MTTSVILEGAVPSSGSKRVLIIDDHPVFRFGLCQLVGASPEFTVCGEAWNAPSALQALRQLIPEVVLLDISMPGTNGIELLKLMLAEKPNLLVLMISLHEESLYALRALRAGAKGYLMKDEAMGAILEALRRITEGGVYVSPRLNERLIFKVIHSEDSDLGSPMGRLSDRELEILELLGRGASTRTAASQLHLSVKTIETHRAHLKQKLGFRSQDELVKFAGEWKIAKNE